MSLAKEQLSSGGSGKYGGRRTRNRSKWRQWAKNQLSRWLRRTGKAMLDEAPEKPRFIGYE
jgi:hypothetical protein